MVDKLDAFSASLKAAFEDTALNRQMKVQFKEKLAECGFSERVRQLCNEEISKSGGIENINIMECVEKVVKQARQMVPAEIKHQLMSQIDSFVEEATKV